LNEDHHPDGDHLRGMDQHGRHEARFRAKMDSLDIFTLMG
jgi:hypothetical protein